MRSLSSYAYRQRGQMPRVLPDRRSQSLLVLREVHLLHCPEARYCFFVHGIHLSISAHSISHCLNVLVRVYSQIFMPLPGRGVVCMWQLPSDRELYSWAALYRAMAVEAIRMGSMLHIRCCWCSSVPDGIHDEAVFTFRKYGLIVLWLAARLWHGF